MKIEFEEITAAGLHLTIDDGSWFPVGEVALKGPPWARIFLVRKGDKRVFFAGEIKARVGLACDRCLDAYEYPVEDTFEIDLELRDPLMPEPSLHEYDVNKMDTVYLDEPVIDIYQLLTQQVYLGLPHKRLCKENCLGLCADCGAALNTENCRCPKKTKISPFAVLMQPQDK